MRFASTKAFLIPVDLDEQKGIAHERELMKPVTLFAAFALSLAACTSIQVRSVDQKLQTVCIVENPKVTVPDFVAILRDGLSRHDIVTSVVSNDNASSCPVTLTYTALRSWDFSTYVSHAELRLWSNGKQIGSADYHLRNKGGLALTKWASTKSKMDPVIDQLITGKPRG